MLGPRSCRATVEMEDGGCVDDSPTCPGLHMWGWRLVANPLTRKPRSRESMATTVFLIVGVLVCLHGPWALAECPSQEPLLRLRFKIQTWVMPEEAATDRKRSGKVMLVFLSSS